jgi:phosphoglycolate phosphatase-like HAD superfamily hydrolase
MKKAIKAIVCDFDGTFSTLRCGWEAVMKSQFLRYLDDEKWIDEFIGETTGIQTILQMKGFLAELRRRRVKTPSKDPWYYKNEYNEMLMASVAEKRDSVISGKAQRERYLVPGSLLFLQALKTRGVKIYFASGTDQADVRIEAAALGLDKFADGIEGALPKSEKCAKEAAIRRLVKQAGVRPGELAVIGDGKVEIALGKAAGARTVGLATDEVNLSGLNPVKHERLLKAGADVITGDFLNAEELLGFLGV